MKKLNFTIEINASAPKVWQTLWEDANYRRWTAVFQEGSHTVSDWQEGSKIFFLDASGQNGMTSRIAQKVENKFMAFEHVGFIKDGIEDFEVAQKEGWANMIETYQLTTNEQTTHLKVSIDVVEQYEAYFDEKFPLALAKVKSLAESPIEITIETVVNAPIEKVWDFWTNPAHIVFWNSASEDWHTTAASNDLEVGGKFSSRMEAKDGSVGFDFEGTYTEIDIHKKIAYILGDNRHVSVLFWVNEEGTYITETFEAENLHPIEMQRMGWNAILDNFKKYVEAN
jgi:uncharacterized protein YndB with AHSA1/START domain